MKREGGKHGPDKRMIVAYVLLAVILFNAAFYAFTHYEGPSGYGDDSVYASLAASALQGSFTESQGFIFSVRLLSFYPTAFFYLFGANTLTSSLFDILSYFGLIIIAFYFAKMFYSYKEGVISAFLISIFPIVTKFAVNMGEDVPLTFVTSLAVVLFLYGERGKQKWSYFLSGALIVAAWLISYESGAAIAFLAVYALIELARKKIRIDKSSLFFVYGIVIALLLTFIFSYFNSGFPFITITENIRFYSAVGTVVNGLSTIPSTNVDLLFYPQAMFQYHLISVLMHSSPTTLLGNIANTLFPKAAIEEYGLYFYLLVICAAVLLILRDRRSFFTLFWLAFLIAFLEFGPMDVLSLHPVALHYTLAYRLGRFMMITAVPLSAAIAMSLGKLLEFKNRYFLAFGSVVLVLILALLYAQNTQIENYWYQWQMYQESLAMQPAGFIRATAPNATVYLEEIVPNAGNIGYLSAFWVYLGSYKRYSDLQLVSNSINCSNIEQGSYIVWAGPPACGDWKNVFNVSVPSYIPQSIVSAESFNLRWIITNVYYSG